MIDQDLPVIRWDNFATWGHHLDKFLAPFLTENSFGQLRSLEQKPKYIDDMVWVDEVLYSVLVDEVEYVIERLAEKLVDYNLHTFHACNTSDASEYHSKGILLNDPEVLSEQLRKMVQQEEAFEYFRSTIDGLISGFDSRDRDTGQLFLCADERSLIEDSGHYLLYGSEWVQCVLGWGAHRALRNRGTPTVIDVMLPLQTQDSEVRNHLARDLLHEWTRARAEYRENEIRDIDFSFLFREPIPASWVISHHHPSSVSDPFHHVKRKSHKTTCIACE